MVVNIMHMSVWHMVEVSQGRETEWEIVWKQPRGEKGRKKDIVVENEQQTIPSGVSRALCILKTFI